MNQLDQIVFASALATLGIAHTAVDPASAAIINFEISFFTRSNNQVGNGAFSFDDEASACFESAPEGVCDPANESFGLDAVLVTNVLTDFSATTYGINWSGIYEYWWADEDSGQVPGAAIPARFPAYQVSSNYWFFGDPFLGEEQNIMTFNQSSETEAEGTWSQFIVAPPPNVPQDSPDLPFFFTADGIWQARRVNVTPKPEESVPKPTQQVTVPEPSNIFGVLIAIAFGYRVKRQLARINT